MSKAIRVKHADSTRSERFLTEHFFAVPYDLNDAGRYQVALFPDLGSPFIYGDMIGLVDVACCDADRLIGCVVAVRMVYGLEAMRVCLSDGLYCLSPLRSGVEPKVLRSFGECSIAGRIVKWIANAPEPVDPEQCASRTLTAATKRSPAACAHPQRKQRGKRRRRS